MSISASQVERAKMDKRPYYRQSGVVFSLVRAVFLLNAVQAAAEWHWIFDLVILPLLATIGYAVAASVPMGKKK